MAFRYTSIAALLKHVKLVIQPVVGENSFYRAVSAAYYNDAAMHLLLRRTVSEHILEDTENYLLYFQDAKRFLQLIQTNKTTGSWTPDLSEIIPHAIAKMLDLKLELYTLNDDESVNKAVFGSGSTTVRLLQEGMDQYSLLLKD